MARLPSISNETASPEQAELFAGIKGKIGIVPNLYRVTANAPAVLKGLLSLGDALAGGTFDARTREAIALAVAGENHCDYCASAHSAISASLKVEPAEIAARLAGHSSDPRLQAILTFARRVVAERGLVSDADLSAARAAGLSDAEIVEVVGNVVVNLFTNYLNHVADTEIDFPVVRTAAIAA
jgi:uncharacterized peroxidase-related enzyme